MIEKCDEGGEGLVIESSPLRIKDIISLNVCRCTNEECPINSNCKRYIQNQIDLLYPLHEDIVKAEFCMILSSDPDFDYTDYCGKYIKNE